MSVKQQMSIFMNNHVTCKAAFGYSADVLFFFFFFFFLTPAFIVKLSITLRLVQSWNLKKYIFCVDFPCAAVSYLAVTVIRKNTSSFSMRHDVKFHIAISVHFQGN